MDRIACRLILHFVRLSDIPALLGIRGFSEEIREIHTMYLRRGSVAVASDPLWIRELWDRELYLVELFARFPYWIRTHNRHISEEVQLAVVYHRGRNILHFPRASKRVLLAAVTRDASVLECIGRAGYLWPTEDELQEIVAECPGALPYVPNPSEAVQLAGVARCPRIILRMHKPCESAQVMAVTMDPALIRIMWKPCDAAVQAAGI